MFGPTPSLRPRFAQQQTSRSMGAATRYVEREEVADAVYFLCFSDAARSITGQVIQLG